MANFDKMQDEGNLSYLTNKGAFLCPYARGTPEFDSFERGWVQALKRDPNPVSATPYPVPLDYTHAATTSAHPPEHYNAYADMKGRGAPRK